MYIKTISISNNWKKYKEWKARKCNCVEIVDIGYYNNCPHLCKYCYSNYDEKEISKNTKLHDKISHY